MTFKFGITFIFKNTIHTYLNANAKAPAVFREIKLDDIRRDIPLIRPMNESKFLQFEERIIKRGDRCFVAYVENKPVHYSWLRTHGLMYVSSAGHAYAISNASAWIFDCRTSLNFRGLGIYPFVLSQLCKDILAHKSQVYIDTSRSNVSSIVGIRKAGFTLVSKVYRIGPFSFSIPRKLR